jgi:hypothetical protein
MRGSVMPHAELVLTEDVEGGEAEVGGEEEEEMREM